MPSLQEFYKERHEALRQRATQQMQGFTFRNLSSHAEGPEICEIWRCQKPGTGHWAFDIAVTKRGMTVFGDIDGMIFQAGHGLAFLAGSDPVYMMSKLEPQCREEEFDHEVFAGHCIDAVKTSIEGWIDLEPGLKDSGDAEVLTGIVTAIDATEKKACGREALDTIFLVLEAATNVIKDDGIRNRVGQAQLMLRMARSTERPDEASTLMSENEALFGTEWWELRASRPSQSLVVRLESVRIAGRAIQAQIARDTDAAFEHADTLRGQDAQGKHEQREQHEQPERPRG